MKETQFENFVRSQKTGIVDVVNVIDGIEATIQYQGTELCLLYLNPNYKSLKDVIIGEPYDELNILDTDGVYIGKIFYSSKTKLFKFIAKGDVHSYVTRLNF